MNNIILEDKIKIENMIYEVRGKQVMLSSDVAKLYRVETRRINEVIKRNINRFPDSFCFQLANDEVDKLSLRSQFATLNKNNNLRGQHYKYLPYVLTEQGIMMLSGLLKSDIAVEVNIQIIDAFVKMRNYLSSSLMEQRYINNLVLEHEEKLKLVDEAVKNNPYKFPEKFSWILTENEWVFLRSKFSTLENDISGRGHYRKYLPRVFTEQGVAMLATILKSKTATETSIRIMDTFVLMRRYISSGLIEQRYINNLVIEHEEKLKLVDEALSNFKEKNHHLFHDRFIILDKKILYHSGASFKDLGNKCFEISKIEESDILENLLKKLSQ